MEISTLDPLEVLKNSNLKVIQKNREEFFQTIVGIADSKEYTIEEAIKYVANVMGGVHTGKADGKRAKLKELERICEKTKTIFPNTSLQLDQIRTFGKIILRALKPLQYKILELEIFENQKGLTYHFIINISKQINNEDNFILGFGTEENKNKVSLFVNSNDQICLRFIDSQERIHKIIMNANSFYYREAYLYFELGFFENQVLLSMGDENYTEYLIYQTQEILDSSFTEHPHSVLGSDIKGKKLTNMSLLEILSYAKILNLEEKDNLWGYFLKNVIDEKYNGARVTFQGNQLLHSQNHPNFPTNN
jgi:hypothetical protein